MAEEEKKIGGDGEPLGEEWQNLAAPDVEKTEDDLGYEEWLKKRSEGVAKEDFEGEKNETYTMKRGKVVLDEEGNPVMRKRAAFGNTFEYTPIQKGEHADIEYKARLEWMNLAAEKNEESPKSEIELEDFESSINREDYPEGEEGTQQYLTAVSAERAAAKEKIWREKVGLPSYEEYLSDFKKKHGIEEDTESAPESEEGAEDDPGKSLWSKLSKEERRDLIHRHRRHHGEKTEDWAKRIEAEEGMKIFSAEFGGAEEGGGDDTGEAAGDGGDDTPGDTTETGTAGDVAGTDESDTGVEAGDEGAPDGGVAGGAAAGEGSSDEGSADKEGGKDDSEKTDEAAKDDSEGSGEKTDEGASEGAEDKDDKGDKTAESEKDAEKLKQDLLRELASGDLADWIEKEKGLTRGDLNGKTPEELQALIDEYNKEKEKSAEEEAKRLKRELATGQLAIWIMEKKGLTRGDIDKMSPAELKALIDEYGEHVGSEPKSETREKLILATIDIEKDAKIAARAIAEDMLDETLHTGGKFAQIVKGVIWGNMFREGVLQRYQKQAMEMIVAKQKGEATDLSDAQWGGSKAGIERFVTAYVTGMQEEMISRKRGESMDVFGMEKDDDGVEHAYRFGVDEDGNRTREMLDENSAEAKATKDIRDAIADYAQGKLSKEQFEGAMHLAQQNLNGTEANLDLMISNYMNVAEAARESYDHSKSIDDVMDGFTFINGERRDRMTPKHRGAINKITEALTESRIGRYIPPEVLGTATSLAMTFGKSGLRTALIGAGTAVVGATVAPAVVPIVAGMLVAGAGSAVKENHRVNVDRDIMMERLARGEEVGADAYSQALKKTAYTVETSKTYEGNLQKAIDSGNADDIKAALATVEAAISFTDSGKRLIDYGDTTEAREQNTQSLAILRAQAKATLKEQGISFDSEVMTKAIEGATAVFEKDIKAKDAAFARQKIWKVMKQSAKAAAVTGVVSVGAQEAVALVSRNMSGVLDRALGMQDNPDAQSTLLAGALGLNKRVIPVNAEAASNVRLSPEEQARLRSEGYTITKGDTQYETDYETVSGEQYFRERGNAECTSWLNNGTTKSDGTELQGYFRQGEGPFTVARGVATNPATGESYDLSQMGDKIKIYIRPTRDSDLIALDTMRVGSEIQVDPALTDDATMELLRAGGYYQAQIGIPTGIKDGMETFSSVATFGGTGQLPAEVTRAIQKSYETVNVIGFNKTVEQAVAAFPAIGAAGRKNLRRGKINPTDKVEVRTPYKTRITTETIPDETDEKPPVGGPETGSTPPPAETVVETTTPESGTAEPESPSPAETVVETTTSGAETTPPAAEEAPTVEAAPVTLKLVKPGEVELPDVLTKEYERIDSNSHSTLIDISDEDIEKLMPTERIETAREVIGKWNAIPAEKRREYLVSDSDDGLDMDATSLDVAKTLEALGLIKSGRSIDLATGVTAAPEQEAHADALEKVDDDALWFDGGRKEFTDTIKYDDTGDLRIYATDDTIRRIARGSVLSEGDVRDIQGLIGRWNLLFDEEQRELIQNPRYRSEAFPEADVKRMEDLHLIERQSPRLANMDIRMGNGETVPVAVRMPRRVNNISPFRPGRGRGESSGAAA